MESTFIILFSIATLVALVTRRTPIPFTVALVIVGLIVGRFQLITPPRLTKELLFALFLPGLVFEAAYNIHVTKLRSYWRTVAALAVPGVLLTVVLVAVVLAGLLRVLAPTLALGWQTAIVFAALIAATDPIAVVALFRQLGVSDELTTLVEAESLLNDGTAIVILTLILTYVSGARASVAMLTGEFFLVIIGASAVGLAVSYIVAHVTKQIDEPMIEIQLTTIAAYGSFVIAEKLHLSGVIATVAAGLLMGSFGRESAMSESTRKSVDTFWHYVAFALNSIIFLLIGFNGRLTTVAPWGLVAVAFVAVVGARAVAVLIIKGAVHHTTERLADGWGRVLTWGGVRGALSMVLALALPGDFPNRAVIIDLTFGVVLLSILIQGTSMQVLIRHLKLTSPTNA